MLWQLNIQANCMREKNGRLKMNQKNKLYERMLF